MTDEHNQLGLLIQAQQKMADDISEIKIMVKEAAQVIHFLRRDQDEMKVRLERVESAHINCPARAKAAAWSISARDFAWLVALMGGIVAVWASFKK